MTEILKSGASPCGATWVQAKHQTAAATVWLRPDGVTVIRAGKMAGRDYKSLQAAIDKVRDGDMNTLLRDLQAGMVPSHGGAQ